jgi:hypothetical protein
VTRRKRQPSAAVRRAEAVERRAAEIAAPLIGRAVLHFTQTERHGMTPAEDRGWRCNTRSLEGYVVIGVDPRGPAELAGWLAREIWSAS